jgi:hypothetical protein
VSIADAGGQPITMITRGGQPLAQPSPLGADGSSFSVSRTATAAPSVGQGSARAASATAAAVVARPHPAAAPETA